MLGGALANIALSAPSGLLQPQVLCDDLGLCRPDSLYNSPENRVEPSCFFSISWSPAFLSGYFFIATRIFDDEDRLIVVRAWLTATPLRNKGERVRIAGDATPDGRI
jgi:hypothetical protein